MDLFLATLIFFGILKNAFLIEYFLNLKTTNHHKYEK